MDAVHSEYSTILVEPVLLVNNKKLSLNNIRMQSVLVRSLGRTLRWGSVFAQQKELGFNMFHLTPVMKVGRTGDLYSIESFSELNEELIGSELELERCLRALEEKLDVGFIVDVVLNHCSGGAPVLLESTEIAYNLTNSPQLAAALELDRALQELSNAIAAGDCEFYRKAVVATEEDLREIMEIIENRVLPGLSLHEFFALSQDRTPGTLEEQRIPQEFTKEFSEIGMYNFAKRHCICGEGEGRFSV